MFVSFTDQVATTRRAIGYACAAAAAAAVIYVTYYLSVSPAVSSDRYSYPKTPAAFRAGQVFLAVQHIPLLLGLLSLAALLPAGAARRWARVGAAGMALLTVVELVAVSAANVALDSARVSMVDSLYGLSTLVMAVGLIVAGIVALRSTWSGPAWLAWLTLALGVYPIVPLTPALILSDKGARVALGAWMLLYIALGLGLARLASAGVAVSGRSPAGGGARSEASDSAVSTRG